MTDKELAKKIGIRAGHRAHVSKLLAQSEDLIEQDRPGLTEIKRFIDTFTKKLNLLRELDDDIISLVKDEEIEPPILEGEELRDKICYVKIKLVHKKSEQKSTETNPQSLSPPPVINNSTYLPKLQTAPPPAPPHLMPLRFVGLRSLSISQIMFSCFVVPYPGGGGLRNILSIQGFSGQQGATFLVSWKLRDRITPWLVSLLRHRYVH